MVSRLPPEITWRWNGFSMRLTPTRPSRTRRDLSREGMPAASRPDHVGSGDPVLQAALLTVEAHPQEPEEQRGNAGEVARTARHAAARRRRIAEDVDDLEAHDPHTEGPPDDDLEDQEVDQPDRGHEHESHHQRRIGGEDEVDPEVDVEEVQVARHVQAGDP